MRNGIIIAGEDGDLTRKQLYDSRKKKLTVDQLITPPHIAVLNDFSGGSKFTLPPTDTNVRQETLLTLKHNMPFKPMFICYFYISKAPTQGAVSKDVYTLNRTLMFNSFFTETVHAEVDDTNFYIKHEANRYTTGGPTTYTTSGSDYEYRVRYMILNVPSYLLD